MPNEITPSENAPLPLDVAQKFFKLQLKEVEIKQNEIELKKQQDKNNLEYARESLKVQADDLKNASEHQNKSREKSITFMDNHFPVILCIDRFSKCVGTKMNFCTNCLKQLHLFLVEEPQLIQ